MTPRRRLKQRPAEASPGSSGKTRKFNPFREKKFKNALELVKLLHHHKEIKKIQKNGTSNEETLEEKLVDAGWGVIVGSMKVQKRLEEEGIKATYNPLVAYRNEIILNRAKDFSGSNFFVYIKFTNFKTTAFFTDPSAGEGGRALTKKKLMRKRSVYRGKSKWAEKTALELLRVSRRKPDDAFYACIHGHWGENHGRDDGISPRKDVIRQLILWHYDVDATGYHNWIDGNVMADIARTEKSLGMLKVLSTEFTYRFRTSTCDNGPHLNLWFADEETAGDFQRRFLKGKARKMPGLAPSQDKEDVLAYIRRKRQEKKMALGVAHPSCLLNLGGRRLPVGLINMLNLKNEDGKYYKWASIVSFIQRNADGIGAFNPTVGGIEVQFRNPKVQKQMEELVTELVPRYIGGEANLDENNINMALALFARHTKDKFAYFDHDIHNYASTKYYLRAVSPLSYGRTVFHFDRESFSLLEKRGGLSSEDVIRIMRGRGIYSPEVDKEAIRGLFETGDIERGTASRKMSEGSRKAGKVKISMDTFLELKGEALGPVKQRRSTLHSILKAPNDIRRSLQYVKLVWREWVRRTKSMWRP
ncbi:MAG: hypothetical protein ACLFUZ_03540 [Candidatus Micrarchaeia archaeon]